MTRQATAPSDKILSPEWQYWVTQNLLAGYNPDEVIATLMESSVDQALASAEVAKILSSPIFQAADQAKTYGLRMQQVLDLQRSLILNSQSGTEIPRLENISTNEFERFYSANRPVILSDFMKDWPALNKWSPQYFEEVIGDVMIEAVVGRNSQKDCDRHIQKLTRQMTMRAYVSLVKSVESSNDMYMISHTRNMNLPDFAPLRDDIKPRNDIIDTEQWYNHLSLWFGPKGTVTPLHHDQNNNMFCQVVGQKRVRLISPLETNLLRDMDGGFYSSVNLDQPDLERFPWLNDIQVHEVVLSAGDALFIPVGWWHDVQSLSMSVNLSLINFKLPNDYTWYKPGLI